MLADDDVMRGDDRHDPAIVVEDLWITFKASTDRQTLRSALTTSMRERGRRKMMVEALAGVSFEILHGSVCGVIGRNGAGKTTLLRCIAGILPPTAGRAIVWGRVTPLLSLGLGFNRSAGPAGGIAAAAVANQAARAGAVSYEELPAAAA